MAQHLEPTRHPFEHLGRILAHAAHRLATLRQVHPASWRTTSRGKQAGKGLRGGRVGRGLATTGASPAETVVSSSSSWNSICSIASVSFSEERPNCIRRNRASCIFRFSISSVEERSVSLARRSCSSRAAISWRAVSSC